MVPAVEEVLNSRIQKEEVLQTNIQAVHIMAVFTHGDAICSWYTATLTNIVCFSIWVGMQSLGECNHFIIIFLGYQIALNNCSCGIMLQKRGGLEITFRCVYVGVSARAWYRYQVRVRTKCTKLNGMMIEMCSNWCVWWKYLTPLIDW